MSEEKVDRLKWIECWRRAAPELESIRHEQIRNSNTALAILKLEDAFQAAMLHQNLKQGSGLVEQQRLFRLWRL